MSTICGSMSTEGETLQVSVLPYKCSICSPFVRAFQQRERHSKFLYYLYPTLQMLDMFTLCESMSTEGETLQVSVLPYKCSICSPFVRACQQGERHSKLLSYLTGARYVQHLWEHVNRGRDTPSFCPTLQALDMFTLCESMSTEGETLQVTVLPYRCSICPTFVGTCQQRKGHAKFRSYLTSARYVHPL
jgi:DNA-directed RNA polymerase subunit RPC12/RpoP